MTWLRQAVLCAHLAAATFWIGEILFVALVLGPMGRALPPEQRVALFRETGRRTLPWVWTAIAVLLVTGIGNLYFLHITPAQFFSARLYRRAFGWFLAAKLLTALGMFVNAAMHDFVYGRWTHRIRAQMPQASPERRAALEREYPRARRGAARTGRANLVLALVMLVLVAGVGARS